MFTLSKITYLLMRKMRDMQLNDSVTIYVVAKKITSTSDYTKLDQLGKLESHSLSREWPAMWHSCVCSEDKREILSQPSNGLFVAGNGPAWSVRLYTRKYVLYTILGSSYHHPTQQVCSRKLKTRFPNFVKNIVVTFQKAPNLSSLILLLVSFFSQLDRYCIGNCKIKQYVQQVLALHY